MLEKIHKEFIWDKKRPNIKHQSLIADYSKGGLKDIDVPSKFMSLHLIWIKRLYDENFHPWKKIPLYFIERASSNTSLFVPNLQISVNSMNLLPEFYKNIIRYWCHLSQCQPKTPQMVLSESIWFNSCIKLDNQPINPAFCKSNRNVFVYHLFDNNGELISWDEASRLFGIQIKFKWIQIKNAIPGEWKK